MTVSEAARLRPLEDKNRRLKDVLRKKLIRSAERYAAV